jgi:hypothetical protein
MPTTEAIEERRRQVWEMILKGVPETVISKAFGVHRNTIINDVRVLRRRHRGQVSDADVKEEVGDAVAKFDFIFTQALSDYGTAEKDNLKAQYLEKALNALREKVKFMVEVGVLPKSAQEITGELKVQGVDISKMSVEELKTMRTRVLEQLMQSRMGGN